MTGSITNHPTDESIAAFRRGMTTEEEAALISNHLSTCGDCAQTASALDLVLLGLEAESHAHVPAETLVAFQSRILTDAGETGQPDWTRDKVESHLAYCSQCHDELVLLRTIDSHQLQPRDDQQQRHYAWRRMLRPRIAIPLAAAAMAVFLLVQYFPVPHRGAWQIADPAVDKGKLIASSTRSPGDIPEKTYTNPLDAALASYRSVLIFDNGEFRLGAPLPANLIGDTLTVRLIGHEGELVAELQGALPRGRDVIRDSVHAWVLTLPSRQLRRMPLQSHSDSIHWLLADGNMGCVTWTYRTDSGHVAVPSVTFESQHK